MNLFVIAMRNVLRAKTRTLLTVLGGAIAIVAFIMLRTVVSAWGTGAEDAAKDRITTQNRISVVIGMAQRYVDTVRQVPGVKAATFATFFGATYAKDPTNTFANIAVDPASFLEVYDDLELTAAERARWLANRQGVIVGDQLARQLGWKLGDRVALTGTLYPGDWEFTIDGIYTAKRKSSDQTLFVLNWNYVNDALPVERRGHVDWIMSRVDDPTRGAAISEEIDRRLDEKEMQTLTMSEREQSLAMLAEVSALVTALDIASIIILGMIMMIMGNTIAMGVRERTREYGVLRAIGFSPRHIRLFVFAEAATMAGLAAAVGIALAYPIVQLGMGKWLEENMRSFFPVFKIEPITLVLALALVVALGAAAALLPARRALKLSVTDALRHVA